MTTPTLPELPEQCTSLMDGTAVYTAKQMRAYALAAIAAAHPQQPAPASSAEPVAYSIGRTLHWHAGCGITDAQLYAAPQPAPDIAAAVDAERERCVKLCREWQAGRLPHGSGTHDLLRAIEGLNV